MKKQITLTLIAFHLVVSGASADLITINFDTDANGNPFTAPIEFAQTIRLTEFYASLGVHFSGPGGNDGGAILDQASDFGVNARSGTNFLAFNRNAVMMDNGVPLGPETITFDTLMSSISIYAAGGHTSQTFLMQAFDTNGILVATDTITTQQFAQLQVASVLGIRSIQLSVPSQTQGQGFVFDDLSAETVPEPSTISLLLCVAAIGVAARFRRKKA